MLSEISISLFLFHAFVSSFLDSTCYIIIVQLAYISVHTHQVSTRQLNHLFSWTTNIVSPEASLNDSVQSTDVNQPADLDVADDSWIWTVAQTNIQMHETCSKTLTRLDTESMAHCYSESLGLQPTTRAPSLKYYRRHWWKVCQIILPYGVSD